MRKFIRLGILLALLVAGLGYGWQWWREGRFVETTDNAYVEADLTPISAKVQGYVREVPVGDNQPVTAGQPLVIIEDADFIAKKAEAEAAVEAQKAALHTLDSRLILQKSVVDQSESAIVSAEAELRRIRLDWDRLNTLVKNDFATRQRFDTADADLRKATAALTKARAADHAERDQLTVLQATRRETEARLKQTEATLALAGLELGHTVIRAPVDGVIGNKSVQTGQFVRPAVQLMVLVPLPHVHVVANFKETQLVRMKIGQPVRLSIDAYPGVTVDGRIDSIAPASGAQFSLLPPENATGNFTKVVQRVPVRIALSADNALRDRLRPGLSAFARVDTRAEPVIAQTAKP